MKSNGVSIKKKLLALATGIFLGVTLMGCHDPIVGNMEAERRRLGSACEQELRQNRSGLSPAFQTQTFRPAP